MLPDGYLHLVECPELTIDYLEGGLPRRALRAVEAHLETCADCRKAVAEQKRIATLVQSQEQVNTPHALKRSPMSEYSSALDERGRTEETEGTKTTTAVQSMPATALMAVSGTPTSVGQTVFVLQDQE